MNIAPTPTINRCSMDVESLSWVSHKMGTHRKSNPTLISLVKVCLR